MEKKILVLDDDPGIRKLFKKLLTQNGFQVVLAEDTPEVDKILESETFPIMIFDLNLPTETGIKLCQRVRSRYPVPVIFAMTGHVSLFELSDCRSVGFDDYFKKPFKIETVLSEIENAYNRVLRWRSKK